MVEIARQVVISSEDDLFALLGEIEAGGPAFTLSPGELRFDGWPKFTIRIRGEDFNGGVPTRIMPGLLAIQKAIDEAYSEALYGEKKRLTPEERGKTEIVVYLEEGSTIFSAELWQILNTLVNSAASKMDGQQVLIAILGVAGFIGSAWSYRAWLESRSREKEIDLKLKLSEEETKRHAILANLAGRNPTFAAAKESIDSGNTKMIRTLRDDDLLVLGEDDVIDGERARQVVRKLRTDPIEDRLDGNFRILSVQSGSVRDGFKAQIQATDRDEKFNLDIPEGTLSEEQIESLQHGEWEKSPLYMQINIRRRGDTIIKATLTHAGLQRR